MHRQTRQPFWSDTWTPATTSSPPGPKPTTTTTHRLPPHDDSAATCQRHGQNERIIQGSHPHTGTWHMTVTGEHGLDQRIKISAATGHFAAWMDSPDLLAALASNQPTSLDETITLLNELGDTDITAETARRRAEADAAWLATSTPSPQADGTTRDDDSPAFRAQVVITATQKIGNGAN
ncbi:hypothetical protein ACIBEJ_33620 [Nonomuraea sp. NPDC050790]|uniref:hypothetical protein n=1 Tax=Nonomuraea sp. NPDC050790 TaxID=3364371 RepID=UPI00378A851C